ncbi:GGDEF domain-containing protein [Catenovulum maritimum]|uniref:GGDEF domain-containing protein n=1 Tax=Catenovulum maritimum TaxID=1513271 RepID=UPI00065F8F56|nr:GGDEF domain-containing protein [Catenovulum maritimum]
MDNLQRFINTDTGYISPIKSGVVGNIRTDFEPNFSNLTEQLQTSLKLEELLQIFTHEAARYLQISGVRFQCESICVETDNYAQGIYEHISEIRVKNQSIGCITYAAYSEIEPSDVKILHQMQVKLGFPIKNALQYALLQQQALKDHLTKLGNRASFDENFDLAVEKAQRDDSSLFLFLLDLDNFKQANDRFGHSTGDLILQEFSNILSKSVRRSDLAFRFGGDEFALILNTDNTDVADRVAARINTLVSLNPNMQKTAVTTSLGYAQWHRHQTCEQLFDKVDGLLYDAKHRLKSQRISA